jgi:hypothetical protein
MCRSTGYLLCMESCLLIYAVARILSYACDFHASFINEKSFNFEISSEN